MAGLNTTPTKMDRERKKRKLGKTLNLIHLGGFIKEELEENLRELYPDEVVAVVSKYSDMESGFVNVLEETDKFFAENNGTSSLRAKYVEQEDSQNADNYKTQKWILEQVAKYAARRENLKEQVVWEEWELQDSTRKVLEKFNPLQNRILELEYGLRGKKYKTFEEIAKLEEFQCDPELIKAVDMSIHKIFVMNPKCQREFTMACREQLNKDQHE